MRLRLTYVVICEQLGPHNIHISVQALCLCQNIGCSFRNVLDADERNERAPADCVEESDVLDGVSVESDKVFW